MRKIFSALPTTGQATCAGLLTFMFVLLWGLSPVQAATARQAAKVDGTVNAPSLQIQIEQITPDTIDQAANPLPEVTVSGTMTNLLSDKPLQNLRLILSLTSRSNYSPTVIMRWVKQEQDTGLGIMKTVKVEKTADLAPKESRKFQLKLPASSFVKVAQSQWGGRGVQVSASGPQLKSKKVQAARSILLTKPSAEIQIDSAPRLNLMVPLTVNGSDLVKWFQQEGAGRRAVEGKFKPALPTADPLASVNQVNQALQHSQQGINWILDPALLTEDSPLQTGSLRPDQAQNTSPKLVSGLVDGIKLANYKGSQVSLDLWGTADPTLLTDTQLKISLRWSEAVKELLTKAGVASAHGAGGKIPLPVSISQVLTNLNQLSKDDPELMKQVLPVLSGEEVQQAAVSDYQPSQVLTVHSKFYRGPAMANYSSLSAQLSDLNPGTSFTSTQLARATLASIARQSPDEPSVINVLLDPNAGLSPLVQQRLTQLLSDPWVTPVSFSQAEASSPVSAQYLGQISPTEQKQMNPGALFSPPRDLGELSQTKQTNSTGVPEARTEQLETETNQIAHSKAALPAGNLLSQAEQTLDSLSALSAQAKQVTRPFQQQIFLTTARVYSEREQREVFSWLTQDLNRLRQSLRVKSGSAINLISTHTELPIQIVNELSIPLKVQVVIQPEGGRLQAEKSVTLPVGANSGATAQIPVRAVGNGNVKAQVILTAPGQQIRAAGRHAPQQLGEIADKDAQLSPGDASALCHPQLIQIRIRATWEDRLFTTMAILVGVIFVIGISRAFKGGTRMDKATAGTK